MKTTSQAPSPSEFMRQLRPELYSDTAPRTVHQLNSETLSHHLETITERNQTHEFEVFCRKLCERTICPHLKPPTGPEGGGDSKADTETIPVSEEVEKLRYVVGQANGGRERWAFAFSAKQRWSDKARADVAGIVSTKRGYQKIFFITSRGARAKDRARIEDELSRKYGIQVTVLDRTWIIDEIVDKNRRDLAFNYLGVGHETSDDQLGPTDFSRKQQLAEIESELEDPTAFDGMPMHRATEALVAAKLSRGLEQPRTDVDGRFLRAIRLADDGGTQRQRLEARYEWLWTAFWWFDDIKALTAGYDQFESLALASEHAKNIEFLCNLTQLLFNAAIAQDWAPEKLHLQARVERLRARLSELAADAERPNNALQARASLLILSVNEAVVRGDAGKLSSLWREFSVVLEEAEGLGEFDATQLVEMIQLFGKVAGDDAGYRDLIDQTAEFVGKRTSEGEGALILLQRAQQLDFERNMEMIRLLGKAARRLSKNEYARSLIDALTLLALAYRSAGLLWAARAACTSALASLFIEADEAGHVPAVVFPTLMLGAWISVELKHMPEALDTVRVARGCLSSLPFDEPSSSRAVERLREFDMVLACQILNLQAKDLGQLCAMPDILGGLGLVSTRSALLFVLGYEELLRSEGWIPAEESPDEVSRLFNRFAGQPAADALWRPAVFNGNDEQTFSTSVLGVRVDVVHATTDTSITVSEAVVGVVEALFATAFEVDAVGLTELFSVRIEEAGIAKYEVALDADRASLVIRWPAGVLPSPSSSYSDFLDMLLEVASLIFVATCRAKDMEQALSRLFKNDAAMDRVAMVGSLGLSRSRIFGGVSRLAEWEEHSPKRYELLSTRPRIDRQASEPKAGERSTSSDDVQSSSGRPTVNDHRRIVVRSVIDANLWDRAKWSGALYGDMGPGAPPLLALMFRDREAAERIFVRWRERFGQVDEEEEIYVGIVRRFSAEHPAHYGMVVTSRLPPDEERLATVASRTLTMEPADDVNLMRFIEWYERAGAYLLVPAVWTGAGRPEFLRDNFLLKRTLSVKNAVDVAPGDMEAMFLRLKGY